MTLPRYVDYSGLICIPPAFDSRNTSLWGFWAAADGDKLDALCRKLFAEPSGGRRSYRMLERFKPGLFAQLVVVPLFREHRILSQVAGHGLAVIKGLPPLTVDDDDLTWLADALDATVARASRVPRSFASFALGAAGVRG